MRMEMLRQTCFSPISSLDLRGVGYGCLRVDLRGVDAIVAELFPGKSTSILVSSCLRGCEQCCRNVGC